MGTGQVRSLRLTHVVAGARQATPLPSHPSTGMARSLVTRPVRDAVCGSACDCSNQAARPWLDRIVPPIQKAMRERMPVRAIGAAAAGSPSPVGEPVEADGGATGVQPCARLRHPSPQRDDAVAADGIRGAGPESLTRVRRWLLPRRLMAGRPATIASQRKLVSRGCPKSGGWVTCSTTTVGNTAPGLRNRIPIHGIAVPCRFFPVRFR